MAGVLFEQTIQTVYVIRMTYINIGVSLFSYVLDNSLTGKNETILPGFSNLKTSPKQRVVFGIGETTWSTTDIDNKHPFICESGKTKFM